jgi:Flp pilus assembly protein TadG
MVWKNASGCKQSRRRGFIKSRNGSSAVEFAIIAPIFLALTFAILEAGFFFFIQSATEAANAKAARLIRTGQAQAGGFDKAAFFDEVCDVVKLFGDCNTRLTVEVKRYNSFAGLAADAGAATCRDANQAAIDAMDYQAGASREIIRVRVCYMHKALTPGIGLNLAKAQNGEVKMISTSIFRNEPF